MERAVVITPAVVGRLSKMSADERSLMLNTLCDEEILGTPHRVLDDPMHELAYLMFRDSVRRDTSRLETRMACSLVS